MKWTFRTQPEATQSLARPVFGIVSAIAAVPFAALCALCLRRILPSDTYPAWVLFCVGVNIPILVVALSGDFSSAAGAFSLFYGYLTLLAVELSVLLISVLRRRHAV
jgi:hypothetical protein